MYPDNYREMTKDERKGHWSAVLYRAMRWAAEDGHDEESIFDKKLISELRSFDRDIDEYMPEVLSGLSVSQMEEPTIFLSRLNSQMGTEYKVDWKFLAKQFPRTYKKWWQFWL